MNSKGNTTVYIVIFIVIFLSIIGYLVYYGVTHDWFKSKPEEIPYEKTIYLALQDDYTKELIDGNFSLMYIYNGRHIVKEGIIEKDAVVETKITVPNAFYEFYCWSDSHYVKKLIIQESAIKDKEKIICTPPRFGDYSITYGGSINDGQLTLNISSENNFLRMGICTKWTAGIYRVTYNDAISTCKDNIWYNYTDYYPPKKTSNKHVYNWLPDGVYSCNYNKQGYEEVLENCDDVIGVKCYLTKPSVPIRYKYNADACYITGKFLQQGVLNTTDIKLVVDTTNYLNCMDYVKVYFLDMNRIYKDGDWEYSFSTLDNKDTGTIDPFIEIKPKNC